MQSGPSAAQISHCSCRCQSIAVSARLRITQIRALLPALPSAIAAASRPGEWPRVRIVRSNLRSTLSALTSVDRPRAVVFLAPAGGVDRLLRLGAVAPAVGLDRLAFELLFDVEEVLDFDQQLLGQGGGG